MGRPGAERIGKLVLIATLPKRRPGASPSTKRSAWPSKPTRPRGTLRHRRHEGTRGGEGYRAALLPGAGRLRPLAAGRERRLLLSPGLHLPAVPRRKALPAYNAYSYYKILNAFDTHDVGYQRGGVAAALQRITAECLVVGISTDIIFTVPEMQALHRMLPRSTYHQIDSPFGTTGFWSSTNN